MEIEKTCSAVYTEKFLRSLMTANTDKPVWSIAFIWKQLIRAAKNKRAVKRIQILMFVANQNMATLTFLETVS
jgi:hypothetical protein